MSKSKLKSKLIINIIMVMVIFNIAYPGRASDAVNTPPDKTGIGDMNIKNATKDLEHGEGYLKVIPRGDFYVDIETNLLPVLDISFILPGLTYTDNDVNVLTRGNKHNNTVKWTVTKNGNAITENVAFTGSLNGLGGSIRFKEHGDYILTATVTDKLGRSYSYNQSIKVMPIILINFNMPSSVHYGRQFEVRANTTHLGENNIVWDLTKQGVRSSYTGNLGNTGGTISITQLGEFNLKGTITDSEGRQFSTNGNIKITNTPPTVSLIATPTRNVKNGKFYVDVKATAFDADGDSTTIEYIDVTADSYYSVGTHTIKVRAKDTSGEYSPWVTKTFTIINNSPTLTLTATPTRTGSNGRYLVNISAVARDADGDATTIEYEGRTSNDYYTVGTHTIRARATDIAGAQSAWVTQTFIITNTPPTRPIITRTPSGNIVAPGTPITIKATSSDPDGDAITYHWTGRGSETQVYPLGKNVIRVFTRDIHGAESPEAAIVFFVADDKNGGGMMLTGPESTINENGIDGATITQYTFTVPSVPGHHGDDYGRIRGYNKKTKTWDQIGYQTTNNGITMSGNLPAGTYTQMEFFYYASHCMYNKSNITYSVTYYFE